MDSEKSIRCIRDLTALSALPALWVGKDPGQIAQVLADAAFRMLRSTFVFVGMKAGSSGRYTFSAAKASGDAGFTHAAEELAALLTPWIDAGHFDEPFAMPHPAARTELRALLLPIGYEGKHGLIAAASPEKDFPSEIDRLFISSCANQGSAALRNFDLLEALREREEQERNLLSQKKRRDLQLQSIANAARIVRASVDLGKTIEAIAEQGRTLIGAHQCVVCVAFLGNPVPILKAVSLSDVHEARGFTAEQWSDADILTLINRREDRSSSHGGLIAPLVGHDARRLGFIHLSGRYEGDFTEEDEAVLAQLAHSGSTAIENAFSIAREKKARAEAEVQRLHLYSLFMKAPASICILRGPEHVFEFSNPLYDQLVGNRALIGRSIREAFPELEGQGIYELLEMAYAGKAYYGEEVLVRLDRGDGALEDRFFNFIYEPMRDSGGQSDGVMVFAFEVTAQVLGRKRAEDAVLMLSGQKRVFEQLAGGASLQEILDLLATIAEEQSKGVLASVHLLDADGVHLKHGASPNLPREFSQAIHETPIGPDVGSCGTAAFSGKPVIVSDIASDPLWKDFRELALGFGLKACWSVPILSSHRKVLGTFALYYREPREPGSLELQYIDVLARTAAIAIERKHAEEALKNTQEQLAQSQKMESIGKLAGGIAHDFNNLLTAINGYAALSLSLVAPEDALHGHLFEIKNAGERAAVLTGQLLAYSRKQVLAPKVLHINEIVSEMHNMLKRIIGEDLEMVLELDPVLGAAKADPGQIEQVILNLVVNARDATPSGGRITLSTRNVVWNRNGAPADIPAGQYVLLSVRDTGTGMEPDIIARIFEPFFTTKKFGKGSGMGLSMVDGIVTQSGGFIKVESAPGKGSAFKVYLPVVPEEKALHTDAHPHRDLKGKETVLLVEDEETVRKFIRQILVMNGYKVIEGKDGQDGLKVSELHEGPIDVLLTDVIMPRMNGRDLAERVVRARPGIKVLFMSGYTDDAIVQQGLLEEDTNFIQKPFTPAQLAKMVREILDPATIN